MTAFPQFIGGAYLARSAAFDAQRCVNLYPELSGDGTSKSVAMLVGTPGLSLWATAGSGGVRGMCKFSASQMIAVIGTRVYSFNTAGTATLLTGSVDNQTTPASMASNGSIIMCVTGAYGYFINPTTGIVTTIEDPDFYGGNQVYFDDGYFVWNRPNTGQFQITNLYGGDIDGLDFATAEGSPDNIVSIIVDHREVWALGENTIEVYYNSGNPDFPFERIQGAFMEIGCAAAASVAKMDNSIVWLASDDRGYGTIQRAVGYTPQRISTHAIEFAIASYTTISDAIAFTYQQEGHLFYQISFPTANVTWVYDAATQLWHERAYMASDSTMNRHRANCQVNFAGETLVGDWQNGLIYRYDIDTFTDNGAAIPRIRAAPHISNGDYRWQVFDAMQIDMQQGIGLTTGQGVAPVAMLQWSDDGGYTWSNQLDARIGALGNYLTRVRWNRLGKSRDRVFRVTITDPVRVIMIGASVLARGMAA